MRALASEGSGKISSYVFFIVLIVLIYLCYLLFKPFLPSIIWAIVLVTLFYPVTTRLRAWLRGRDTLAAVLMCALVLIIIVMPIVGLTLVLGREALRTYKLIEEWVASGGLDFLVHIEESPQVQQLVTEVSRYVDLGEIDLQANILESLKQVTTYIGSRSSRIIQSFSSSVLSFVFMIFAMFYFFRDGEKVVRGVGALSPLAPETGAEGFRQFVEVSKATLYGGVVVGAVQGFLGGLGFLFVGLPSPVLWGFVMALLSLIPVVGATFVWLPAAIILIAQGAWIKGIILIVWGVVVVGLADNFLRPMLVGERTGLHTVLVFFSILGGLKIFGFLGFVIGPVILAVLISFARIFRMQYGPQEES
jgi:predicted PurR-regulated permease PerM